MNLPTSSHTPVVNDRDWHEVMKQSNITKARKKADAQMEKLTTEQYDHLRYRCKTDLMFLCYSILNFTRLSPNLHGHLCAWMERNQSHRFKEILLPRGHFKSTILTLGDVVQIILPDVSGSAPWPRNLGPDCRVLIAHETDRQASNFLFAIAGHFLSNPKLMGLFPECIPHSKSRVNKHELELPRSQTWPEPTVDTMGVGGKSQGRHYNYLKLDDLIGDKARDSDLMMQGAKDWIDNIQSFFSDFGKDHLDLIGTRWRLDDLYDHMHERYEDQLLKYIRGVEEFTGKYDEEGAPILEAIFPEEFNEKMLSIIRKNEKVYAAQYANDPTAGATEFTKSWKRYFEWINRSEIAIFTGETRERISISDLDICILFDPAMVGKAGIVVTGTDKKGRVFTLEALKDSWKPPEACDLIFNLVAKWNPRLVAIEAVLFSGLFQNWFEAEMKLRGTYFNVVPVEPKLGGRNIAKDLRVRELTNYFSGGLIFFHPAQDDLIKEFDHFGATKDYHMLDALAYGPDVWMPGTRMRAESNEQAIEEFFKDHDPLTGYSVM